MESMTDTDISLSISDMQPGCAIDILLIDGFSMLSYAAATEPFRAANILSGQPLYSWRHLTPSGDPATASNSASLAADGHCSAPSGADLIMVVAGGDPTAFDDSQTFAWLRRAERQGATIVGISGAPFLLARAGLLHGYSATVHWEHQPEFREAFPDVALQQTLFVFDRKRVTCAGGMAGLDMAVELIARVHGRSLAARTADWFISTHLRDASGQQRPTIGTRYGITSQPLIAALALMEHHIEEPLSREAIAQQTGVSLRQLERLFARHLSSSMNRVSRDLRLDHAAHLLRTTDLPLAQTSAACGFVSIAHFSRAFRARHGVAPGALRQAYRMGHY
jgi:transcriptional regulator GlxA family with amidase domain